MDLSFKSPKKDRRIAFWTYTGSFLFALILIVIIHEFGHAIAYLMQGYTSISITINPFMGVTSTTETVQLSDAAFIALGGTIFNLSIALLLALILHFIKNPAWIPLKMYSAMAFLIEGMVMVAGVFFEEIVSDFQWMVSFGWSPVLVFILGLVILFIGSYLMYELWILLGIGQESTRSWILVFNSSFLLYFIIPAIITPILIPAEMDFISRFVIVLMILHWIWLGIRIILAPIILAKINPLLPKDIPPIDKVTCIFTLILGVLSWIASFVFWN